METIGQKSTLRVRQLPQKLLSIVPVLILKLRVTGRICHATTLHMLNAELLLKIKIKRSLIRDMQASYKRVGAISRRTSHSLDLDILCAEKERSPISSHNTGSHSSSINGVQLDSRKLHRQGAVNPQFYRLLRFVYHPYGEPRRGVCRQPPHQSHRPRSQSELPQHRLLSIS